MRQRPTVSPMDSFEPSSLDEGYSEAPLTVANVPDSAMMPAWLASVPLEDRTQHIMNVMDTLSTAQICEIVRHVHSRLYINFFRTLPPEVCLKILGFLDPISLINTARTSREWMLLAFDRKLWEHLYYLEGFRVIPSEIRKFEFGLNSEASFDIRAPLRTASPLSKLPALPVDMDAEMLDVASPVPQESIFGRAGSSGASAKSEIAIGKSKLVEKEDEIMSEDLESKSPNSLSTASNMTSSLVSIDRSSKRKVLNWQYIYTQRRRLEANWEAEKFTNFQLPHPDHPEERHRECIYTIQHSGKFLVSGSRDKTIRIWNLDTQRLVQAPLTGHTGSVLCLQFDADPEEDIIVSGSSDATVCIWKFSTGQLVQRLKKAHYESVLNVKFDKNVLVTCSKDKTIKVFNRHPLRPGDRGYPGMGQPFNPVPTYLNNYGFNPTPTAGLAVKPAYSMIARLDGHGAAVNAVQILDDQVVSASGDRTIKIWNWPEQACVRTLLGHTKGIACVQYDGRRIVSGSSDNEVKVFDKESGLEVASLRAHSDLVRTVQAGFGDFPYSEEEDKETARAIDHEYFRAVDAGEVSPTEQVQRKRARNAGSRRPEDITAYGATLPPGGGGGKYGRIVSGSYDGTIIIWRRDKEGVWKAQQFLRQEEGAIAARNSSRRTQAVANPVQTAASAAPVTPAVQQATANVATPAVGTQAGWHNLIDNTLAQGPTMLQQVLLAHPQIYTMPYLQTAIAALPTPVRAQLNLVVAAVGHTPAAGQAAQGQAAAAAPGAPAAPAAPHPHHAHRHNEVYRVFKLQFDARRIISCSQTPVIVGWDFANGDEQIIEASKFFAPIE
ncbi:WD domain-containing protein [Phlyctema vagabunda]|uniref:WD domain-containing protein n=1 Tax=Phlyctema vagabunda TaxID=108571 RepID=A0ABR4PXN2_9HELO